MTFGSLFAGAGGFDMGFDTVGTCLFQVEIDPTARDVLARHWADVPKHKDVREVGKHNLPSADVVIGGFPCQDLSVAGNRKGLQGGTRSGLFYELARIAIELQSKFLVFENVPGLLSSDDGRDFARVLRHLGDNGFCGGWRVLDAEGFGVAQHRRRVFGVFSRGRAGADCCAEILALRESLSWHPSEGRKAGTDVAGDAEAGAGMRGVVNALTANGVGTKGADDTQAQAQAGHFIPQRAHGFTGHDGGVNEQDSGILLAFGGNKTSGDRTVAAGLNAKGGSGRQDFESENFIVRECIPIDMRQASRGETMTNNRPGGSSGGAPGTGIGESGDPSPTIAASHVPAVAFSANNYTTGSYRAIDVSPPLTTNADATRGTHLPVNGLSVRRLTPRECERIMDWPDDHTRYRADGREIADGPRYRLCGNGIVRAKAAWIARRLLSAIGDRP